MANLGWLDVTDISFNALLLLERHHVEHITGRKPDASIGTALQAHPSVQWYLRQTYPPIENYLNDCLKLAKPISNANQLRQAEIAVLEGMQDWLIYVLNPAAYDQLKFLTWDDSSLLGMTDFKDKTVLDIGSGTGRLAFTVAPLAWVVFAVEPVTNLRRFIVEKGNRLGINNVYPLDGILTKIPLPDDFADILMAGHVFGEYFEQEYLEMQRVVRDGGSILLHPGTNAVNDDDAHHFLIEKGFEFDTFEEPGDGLKRKYWKII